jgi:pantoate--beta-alanine ligase
MIRSRKTARLDYVKAVEIKLLEPVTIIKAETLIAIACHFGKARLIDNTTVRA